jgi:predicted AAA+ superfamily ATPase
VYNRFLGLNVLPALFIEKDIPDPGSKNKVKLLLGPRQSGKSTMLKHCLAGKDNKLVINLQDRKLRIKYERDVKVFLRELALLEPGTIVPVDEIQIKISLNLAKSLF